LSCSLLSLHYEFDGLEVQVSKDALNIDLWQHPGIVGFAVRVKNTQPLEGLCQVAQYASDVSGFSVLFVHYLG